MQGRTNRLLILDNAEDETSIQACLPKTGNCRTLLTSRFASWSAALESVQLSVLEPEPTRALLVARARKANFTQLAPAEQAACDELSGELGSVNPSSAALVANGIKPGHVTKSRAQKKKPASHFGPTSRFCFEFRAFFCAIQPTGRSR